MTVPPFASRPLGVDLSSHNGFPSVAHDPDFQAMRAAGVIFVVIKKGQGNNYVFPHYAHWVDLAEQAGLIVLDYWYLSYNSLPADQVPRYLEGRTIKATPFFDFENWSDAGEFPRRDPEYMKAWGHDFAIQAKSAFGKPVGLYTYPYFYNEVLGNPQGSPFADGPLWIADYSQGSRSHGQPVAVGSWPFHTIWQYTSTGTVSGLAGVCDLNRFNGDLAGLERLAGV